MKLYLTTAMGLALLVTSPAFAGMDAPASSERTRALLDWAPAQPGLLADIGRPGYFGG